MVTLLTRERLSMEEINKVDGFTPRVQRLKQRLAEARPTVAGERAEFYLEAYKLTEGEHPAKRQAKAFANLLKKMPIAIRDDELLVGAPTPHIRGAFPNHEQAPAALEYVLTKMKPTTGSAVTDADCGPEDTDKIVAAAQYWQTLEHNKRASEVAHKFANGLMHKIAECRLNVVGPAMVGIWTPLVLGGDYEKVLAKGINGIIAEARDEIERIRSEPPKCLTKQDTEKLEFLEAVIITLEAFICFARRHADLAREMAAKESAPERKKELEEIAEICDWVPANPARNFREALQSYWFVPVAHDMEKAQPNHYVGRFDQYLWPFYEKDINEGRMTRQEAAELLGCVFVKWASLEPFLYGGVMGKRTHQDVAMANYIVNVTLGGVTRGGRDAANELSCLVLQVAKQVRTHQPHISIRWHRAMAPEFLDKAIECNRDHGGGVPAWFNDRVAIEYLIDRGVSYGDARDWAMAGCVNTAYPKSYSWRNAGPGAAFINHAKLLEITLNNGMEPLTGVRMGPATGDPGDFRTFDELVAAYKEQIDHYYEFYYSLWKEMEKVRTDSDTNYMPFASALMEDCIKNGTDCCRGGTRYPEQETGIFVDRAIPDVTDSLMAIKKVVFEDKQATMDQLLEALKADFEGYDELRQRLLAAPKYGNDLDEPDALFSDIWTYTRDRALSYRTDEGLRPRLFRQGASWAQWAGKAVGALPNGRKAWTTLADASLSPVQGCDRKGPTAVMNSVSKMDMMYQESSLLNMKFAPTMLKSKEGKQKFADLLATYFDRGGSQVQFNILDRDMLLDAKAHPENYRDLVVRVAGYSAFWVELSPEVQDDIILRTEQKL